MYNLTMEENIKRGEIIIYKSAKGPDIKVKIEAETAWLTQSQISEIFNTERSVITKHLKNIFESGELSEKKNVQKMHIANSNKPVQEFLKYSLKIKKSVMVIRTYTDFLCFNYNSFRIVC